MKTLKVLSALLCYPQPEWHTALGEMREVIQQENVLPARESQALLMFLDKLERSDLMRLQEKYIRLFDRGRTLSLHLFEHIHGESRDRGQAMVDLIDVYRRNGFELSARELPDYIPLFLEYLAQRPADESLDMLADAIHVIALLGARLAERGSDYHVVFDALTVLVGEPENIQDIRQQAATEGPDQTVVNMDKIWEEEAVTFLGNQDVCNAAQSGQNVAQPVQWVSSSAETSSSTRPL